MINLTPLLIYLIIQILTIHDSWALASSINQGHVINYPSIFVKYNIGASSLPNNLRDIKLTNFALKNLIFNLVYFNFSVSSLIIFCIALSLVNYLICDRNKFSLTFHTAFKGQTSDNYSYIVEPLINVKRLRAISFFYRKVAIWGAIEES